MAKLNKVCTNIVQDFTDAEKARARANIGAGTSDTGINYNTTSLPPTTTTVNEMSVFDDGRTKFDNLYNGIIPEEPGQSDDGKVLVAGWTGSPGKGFGLWKDVHDIGIREVPAGTSENAGKALILDSQGNVVWAGNTVPEYTVADAGKRLEVNGSGTGLTWSSDDPVRHIYGYELNPNVFTDQTTLTDFQVSNTGVNLNFQSTGDYFVTGMFCMSNDSNTQPTGYITIKYNVDDSTTKAGYSRLDTNVLQLPIKYDANSSYTGGFVNGMITCRFSITTPGIINFKWYVSFANISQGFTNSSSVSGAAYMCFPNNFITKLTQGPSNIMAFYAEKI